MTWVESTKRWLARHRRGRWVKALDRRLVELHQGFENRDYDPHRNGESRLLKVLSATSSPETVFDVGAHVGDWARLARQAFPDARIHCFEPLPDSFARLQATCGSHPGIELNPIALADRAGSLELHYAPGMTQVATCVGGGFTEDFHHLQTRPEQVRTTTGDLYCSQHGVDRVDFLKLDVEGYEANVLQGFETFLRDGRIKVIQFEYGYVNIATKFLLKDFYGLLEPLGMRIGKIYPTYVDFRPYRHQHEDFLGPNFLAVHRSLDAVIAALA